MNENKANYAKIGFFVLVGVALMLLVIGIAGARVFNKDVILAETYFNESVTGLDIGSPVKYRGVPVGEIRRIGFVFNEYGEVAEHNLNYESTRQILVVMALEPKKFGLIKNAEATTMLTELVKHGLRVKIALSGVTGIAFLELDYVNLNQAPSELVTPIWHPNTPYIPSIASTMTTIKKAVDDVFVKLAGIDLHALGNELLSTLYLFQDKLTDADLATLTDEATCLLSELRLTNHSIQKLVNAPELEQLPADLAASVSSARRSTALMEERLTPFVESLQSLSERANITLASFDDLITTNRTGIQQTVSALQQTAQTLNRTALTQQSTLSALTENLRSASDHLDRALEELRANPSILLFGQPPKPLPETQRSLQP